MRFSKAYIKTLKETPKEAEIASHKLMLRAAMIKKLASGIYAYLPLFSIFGSFGFCVSPAFGPSSDTPVCGS